MKLSLLITDEGIMVLSKDLLDNFNLKSGDKISTTKAKEIKTFADIANKKSKKNMKSELMDAARKKFLPDMLSDLESKFGKPVDADFKLQLTQAFEDNLESHVDSFILKKEMEEAKKNGEVH